MRSSYVIATIIALAAIGWIASGPSFLGAPAEDQAAEAQSQAAQTEPATEETHTKPLKTVRVMAQNAMPHAKLIKVRGRTKASRDIHLKAEIPGKVVQLLVDKGAQVKQGQVLAILATEDRQARLKEAKALVRQKELDFEASERLKNKGYRAQTTLARNEAELEAARANLKQIQEEIADTQLRAPFDGTVEELPIELGSFLDKGDVVARIIDRTPILLVGEVTERDVNDLALGQVAEAKLITGEKVAGRLSYVGTVANEATRTYAIEVEVPNPDLAIRSGMTANIKLNLAAQPAYLVSPAILTLNAEGVLGIRSVDDQGIVHFHDANILADTEEGLWLGDLPEQLNIITVGQEFVKDGEKVKAEPVSQSPTPGQPHA